MAAASPLYNNFNALSLNETSETLMSTKEYKLSDIQPMYPVLVEVSKSPLAISKFTSSFTKSSCCIAKAINYAVDQAMKGENLRISIIVHPGTYTFESPWCIGPDVPDNCAIEIIGLGNVKVMANEGAFSGIIKIEFTVRNIAIWDKRIKPAYNYTFYTFGARENAKLDLFDVKICAPDLFCVIAYDSGTQVNMFNCTLSESKGGVFAMEGGSLSMTDCYLYKISCMGGDVRENAHFRAARCNFVETATFQVRVNSQAFFESCKFTSDRQFFESVNFSTEESLRLNPTIEGAFGIAQNSKAEFKDCSFSYSLCAIMLLKAEAIVENCKFSQCIAAFSVSWNSHLISKSTKFDCNIVLAHRENQDGSVSIEKGKMLFGARPKFIVDKVSQPKTSHDFKPKPLFHFEEKSTQTFLDLIPTDKEMSRYTKSQQKHLIEDPNLPLKGKGFRSDKYKICDGCSIMEDINVSFPKRNNDRFAVFKYCKRCKRACYCSKKCQKDNWPLHKFICDVAVTEAEKAGSTK